MPRRFFDPLTITGFFLLALITLPGCNSEVLEKQAELIKQQKAQIAEQRQEIERRELQEQKQRDCNRAFSDFFEKAQATPDRDRAISLYREGLGLCPDDDIAHYELGKMLAAAGRKDAAQQEFEAALKINPGFIEAKNELEALQNNR